MLRKCQENQLIASKIIICVYFLIYVSIEKQNLIGIFMSKIVTMTNRGMITIPVSLRKKFNLQDGQPMAIIEQEDKMVLIPIIDFEKEREFFLDNEAMKQILDQLDAEELALEEL